MSLSKDVGAPARQAKIIQKQQGVYDDASQEKVDIPDRLPDHALESIIIENGFYTQRMKAKVRVW